VTPLSLAWSLGLGLRFRLGILRRERVSGGARGRLGLKLFLDRSSCSRCSAVTCGYCGPMPARVCTSTAAAHSRANHLRSAGMTYQGAERVLVAESISENTSW
jgi:hypothetical protein